MPKSVVPKETRVVLRQIRVFSGASAIIELFKNQPFRYVFIGEMPMYYNVGRVPVDLELILIPQPGKRLPDIIDLLCHHQSTRFKFTFDHNQLRYIDLSGGIPAGRQNWCEVGISIIQGPPPPKFDLDNIVEIYGIPTIHVFPLFIDALQDLLDQYALRTPQTWLTKRQVKEIRTFMERLSTKVVPQNMNQACTALDLSKQLLAILSGLLPPSKSIRSLTNSLRVISTKIENWTVDTHHRSINDDQVVRTTDREITPVSTPVSSPVTQEADIGPEPRVVGEDHDESDDWVEITMPTGAIKDNPYYCEEQDDEALDFELLSID